MCRLLKSHHRELTQVHTQRVFEHRGDHSLEHVPDFLLAQKRSLDINLGELGLTIRAQVFIPEALGDLVVAVITGHHQQLLEQLGALRQSKKVTVMHPTGHEVVTSAFRRGFAEHGGFDIDEPIGIQKLAHFHGHAVAQHQVVLHIRTAQIQHPVSQACGLAQVLIVQLERRCDRRIKHDELMTQDLDLAAFEVVIGRAIRAGAHQALDLDTKFVANAFSRFEHLGTVRVAYHLYVAFAVTDIHKNHTTMVTATVDPTTQGHGFAQKGFGHKTAIVRAHGHKKLSKPAKKGGTVMNKTIFQPEAATEPLSPWKSHTSVPRPHSSSIQ